MKTIYASEDEIVRIGEGLFAATLLRGEWTHAAHFAAALWLLRYRPELDAAKAMPGLIRAYNESVGRANDDSGGYHETITQASLRALKGVLEANPPDMPLHRIVNSLMASNFANPASARVGVLGKEDARFRLATPSRRNFPAVICGSAGGTATNIMSASPATTPSTAGPAPL